MTAGPKSLDNFVHGAGGGKKNGVTWSQALIGGGEFVEPYRREVLRSASMTFFDLPLEIRDQIYKYALSIPKPSPNAMITFKPRSGPHSSPYRSRYQTWHVLPTSFPLAWYEVERPGLRLLGTSRQFYREAFCHFYSDHILAFDDTKSLHDFLLAIGPRRRLQLTGVFFDWSNDNAKEAFRLLKTCENLKILALTIPCAEAEGLQALKEVRGLETVEVCAVKHVDYPGIAGVHDYWLVTEDHQCYSKHCVPGQGRKNVEALEVAMKRPRLSTAAKRGLDHANPSTYRMTRQKTELDRLSDGYVYPFKSPCCSKHDQGSIFRNPWTRTRRRWKAPFRLPAGRDLVMFDNGTA